MAAAAGILANGVTEILKRLSSVVANEITLVLGFRNELKNLQSTLNMILAVMEDAEKKQLSKALVRLWMEDLKRIAYDAEYILDEYYYEVILCKREKEEYRSKVLSKVHNVFSSSKQLFDVNWKLGRKVKKINDEFNKIAKRKNDLGLQTIDSGSTSNMIMMMTMNRETYSFVAEDWKIVGRVNDKLNIIKMLLDEEEEEKSSNNQGGGGGGGKHVSVIPIVGMGGLGKTTMAQLVYNDDAVKRHFDIKLWICVSDPFDLQKLFKNIAKSLDEKAICEDGVTMESIVCGFQKHLSGKKFLLVLDDVWNEDPADWYKLRTPLMVGAQGSKILITTRNVEVALIMVDKFPPYPLGILNENDCWSLFKEIAFGSVVGAEDTPSLVEIGKEMVYRCKGLPLAVIFLGGLLRSKKKEEEWEIIRDTKLWHESLEGKNAKNKILPSLRLSYDYLPSHLKLCFSYCCLFPKDWKIIRENLIKLWMAEGFLIASPGENTMSMEEIGNEYFHNLLCNFFFQDVEKDDDGDITTLKMHDLVHDLARSVVGNHECLIVESASDIDYISEATRRLNLLVNLDDGGGVLLPKVLKALKKATKLRTIFVNQQTIRFDIGNALKENKRLRVLDLSGSDVTTESISAIGGLKHLRYLDVEEEVLFPRGIGGLSFLQTLTQFNLGGVIDPQNNKNAIVIEALEGLNFLTGDLTISHLENVISGTAARRANLKEKKNLRRLNLYWHERYKDENSKNHEVVLEGLRPHPNLRALGIYNFQGSKLPRWMEDSSCLPNLVQLTLDNFKYIKQVAGFGALPSLKSLTLRSMDNYKLGCLGNEFYYSNNIAATTTTIAAFPSLKKLTMNSLSSLKEWFVPPPLSTTTGAATTTNYYCFPLLEEINIWYCSLLTTITPPTTIFPSLKILYLKHIDGRAAKTLVTNNLNSLTSLRLTEIPNLISLPHQGLLENNNTLLSLRIEHCYEFEGFFPPNNDDDDDQGGGRQQLQEEVSQEVSSSSYSSSSSSLQSLMLYGCPALRFLPSIRSLTSLRTLEIKDCKEPRSLLDELTCLSSSPSLLEHLEHVKILKKNTAIAKEEVVFEWKKVGEFF